MRWEDEPWRKLYTRDNQDWLALSWQAQGLFCLLVRKVDNAGQLDVGKAGRRGVAILLGKPDTWEQIEPFLEELIADGCVEDRGRFLVLPNFAEAQAARMSGALRQRALRERQRTAIIADLSPELRDSPLIYFVQSETGGPIKIGYTDDIGGRMASLQAGRADKLRLLGVIKGGPAMERGVHATFAEYRIRGEWFEGTPAVLEYIERFKERPDMDRQNVTPDIAESPNDANFTRHGVPPGGADSTNKTSSASRPVSCYDQKRREEKRRDQKQQRKEVALTGDADSGSPKPLELEPPPAPLPFKPAEAVALLARAAGSRFVAPESIGRAAAIRLVALIRQAPEPDAWSAIGEWLAAGGEAWRGTLDLRWLIHGENFNAALAHVRAWTQSGKGPVRAGVLGAASRPIRPISEGC